MTPRAYVEFLFGHVTIGWDYGLVSKMEQAII